jgi:plastocyanin
MKFVNLWPLPVLFSLVLFVFLLVAMVGCASSGSSVPAGSAPGSSAGNPSAASSGGPSASAAGGAVTINLTAQNTAFNVTTITVPAGAKMTVNFSNKDNGMPHNFAVYTDSSASTPIFKGQTITGIANATYTFNAPAKAGTYFFRCDVHPTIMTGQFIVQ